MSTYLKILIPLLDETLKKEDLDPETGFVDAYVYDKNRPYIENCVFLMYDLRIKNEKVNERDYRMRNSKNLQGTIVEYISGVPYKIYAFHLISSDIKRVFKGLKPCEYNNRIRVLKFWNMLDLNVNSVLCSRGCTKTPVDWKKIPEFDYRGDPLGNLKGNVYI